LPDRMREMKGGAEPPARNCLIPAGSIFWRHLIGHNTAAANPC
jgi:hypothetical protein